MERINCTKSKEKKDNRQTIGLVFLIIGVVLLSKSLHLIPMYISHFLFTWQMLLITIGTVLIIMNKRNIGAYFLVGIGGIFLLNKISPLSTTQWQLAWPALFIFIGIALISGYVNKHSKKQKTDEIQKPKTKPKSKSKYDDVEFDIDKIEPIY